MLSYVYVSDDAMSIMHRVQANSLEHACAKIEALHGFSPLQTRVMTYADFTAERNCALEPLGAAPWQKRLNRQERRNQFPLV